MTRTALLVALSLSLGACSGLRQAGDGPDAPPDDAPTYPAYESFDPAGYQAEPPPATGTVVHDVPPRVMGGRVVVPGSTPGPAPPTPAPPAAPTPRQVEGFRVQIYATESRESAERVRTEALRWWEGGGRPAGISRDLDVIVAYLQPYYRVRVGAYASREQAEEALAVVRRQYPEAFLVGDVVTVRD